MAMSIRIAIIVAPAALVALAACAGNSGESSGTDTGTASPPKSSERSSSPDGSKPSAPPPPPGGGEAGAPNGQGPKTCAVDTDCQGACPPDAKGCTCADVDNGRVCIPTCTSDDDCPTVPDATLVCSAQHTCTPMH